MLRDEVKWRRIDLGLMALGLVYLALYSIEVLARPEGLSKSYIDAISNFIFVLFALDLLLRVVLDRKTLKTFSGWVVFIKKNWLSLLALLAPMLRSLAVLRVLVVLRGISPFVSTRVSKLAFYVGIALPLVIYTASLSVLESERNDPNANIQNFSDAVWWSLVTVTTVGFGDRFPVTPEGRAVGSFLIFVGIGLFSTLTAVIASWVMSEKK